MTIRSHRAPTPAWRRWAAVIAGVLLSVGSVLAVDPAPPNRARGPVAPAEEGSPPPDWSVMDPDVPLAGMGVGVEPREAPRLVSARSAPAAHHPKPVVVPSPAPRPSAPPTPPQVAPSPTPVGPSDPNSNPDPPDVGAAPSPLPTPTLRPKPRRGCHKHPDKPRCRLLPL